MKTIKIQFRSGNNAEVPAVVIKESGGLLAVTKYEGLFGVTHVKSGLSCGFRSYWKRKDAIERVVKFWNSLTAEERGEFAKDVVCEKNSPLAQSIIRKVEQAR